MKHCNNVSQLRGYSDKADALRIRLLDEIDAIDAKIAKEHIEAGTSSAGETETTEPTGPVVKPKKIKNVTIKHITHTSSWRIENEEDIDKAIDSLRTSLKEALSENDVVNVEF